MKEKLPIWFESYFNIRYSFNVTAVEIINEIKRLPKAEQNRVIEFARKAGENCQRSPDELGALAKRMVDAKDPAEAARLKDEIIRGFYGDGPHA